MRMLHTFQRGVIYFPPFVMAWVAEVTKRRIMQSKFGRNGYVLLASFLVAQITCSKVFACASLDIARIGLFIHELPSFFAQYSTSHKEVYR